MEEGPLICLEIWRGLLDQSFPAILFCLPFHYAVVADRPFSSLFGNGISGEDLCIDWDVGIFRHSFRRSSVNWFKLKRAGTLVWRSFSTKVLIWSGVLLLPYWFPDIGRWMSGFWEVIWSSLHWLQSSSLSLWDILLNFYLLWSSH